MYLILVKFRNDENWHFSSSTGSLENANKLVEELIKEEKEAKERGFYVMPAGPFFSASMKYDENHRLEKVRIVQKKAVRSVNSIINERKIVLT